MSRRPIQTNTLLALMNRDAILDQIDADPAVRVAGALDEMSVIESRVLRYVC